MDVAQLGKELSRLRRAVEDERRVRQAETTALWNAVHGLQEVVQRLVAAAPDVAPDLPMVGIMRGTEDATEDLEVDNLFVRTVPSDQEEEQDILRQLLQGEVSPLADDSDCGPSEVAANGAGGAPASLLFAGPEGVPSEVAADDAGGTPASNVAPKEPALLLVSGASAEGGTAGGTPALTAAAGACVVPTLRSGDEQGAQGGTPKAPQGPPQPRGLADGAIRSCLLVGDSLVRRGRFETRDRTWDLRTWSVSGGTWASMARQLPSKVEEWAHLARDAGYMPSAVVIWLGGNDAYPRHPDAGGPDEVLFRRIRGAVQRVRQQYDVYLLGPAPRPQVDGQAIWETTPAFGLDRRLADLARAEELNPGTAQGRVRQVALGRRFCDRSRGTAVGGGDEYRVNSGYFVDDGVHLTAAGYSRISDRLPYWLRCGGWWGAA